MAKIRNSTQVVGVNMVRAPFKPKHLKRCHDAHANVDSEMLCIANKLLSKPVVNLAADCQTTIIKLIYGRQTEVKKLWRHEEFVSEGKVKAECFTRTPPSAVPSSVGKANYVNKKV